MTAPISNGPTTTRLHHYAGHYSFKGITCEISGDREAPRPRGATSRPPNGGIYAIQGSDTPATHRQSASHGAKPPPTPSHQHVTLHIPRARWNARPSPLTELSEKGDASQCAAQQEPSLLSTRAGLSHTRTRPRGARHCRESVRETGGERSRGRVRFAPAPELCSGAFSMLDSIADS